MHVMVIALLVASAAAYSVGRPPGPSVEPELMQMMSQNSDRSSLPANEYLLKYLVPRFSLPRFLGYDESPRLPLSDIPEHDWLNKEIKRINRMEKIDDYSYYGRRYPRFGGQTPYVQRIFQDSVRERAEQEYAPDNLKASSELLPQPNLGILESDTVEYPMTEQEVKKRLEIVTNDADDQKKEFALTPLDEGYFEPEDLPNNTSISMPLNGAHEGGGGNPMELIEPPRQIRQNPNLSKTKTLVADNLEKFKTTIANENADATDNHINMRETTLADPAESIYGVALVAAICAAFTMAIFVFAFGWYTLSKKAKAAADVDYPAYGVTGPTVDTSGDRKLAHSAHMYHYQHQKQQIIAMERNGLEQRNGSVSDPDSEEENEEGDYTVYECPGFATTGDMEVKNPLFAEDPTPATPAKRDVTKPEPKE